MNLRGSHIAVIDTETTGTDPAVARIVEIAVVVVDGLGTAEPSVELHTRVNPGSPIPPDATKVHGITDSDVAGAPSWTDVWPYVRDLVNNRSPVAYNAPYDAQVLTIECLRAGVDPEPVRWGRWLDPLVPAKLVDQFEKGKRLADVARRRGIEVDAHGAAGDAFTTALLFPRLLGEAARSDRKGRPTGRDLATVEAYLAWQRTTALAQERELVAFLGPRECPWHVLEGVEPPSGQPKAARGSACTTCGVPVVLSVDRDGSAETLNASDRSPHRCAA